MSRWERHKLNIPKHLEQDLFSPGKVALAASRFRIRAQGNPARSRRAHQLHPRTLKETVSDVNCWIKILPLVLGVWLGWVSPGF